MNLHELQMKSEIETSRKQAAPDNAKPVFIHVISSCMKKRNKKQTAIRQMTFTAIPFNPFESFSLSGTDVKNPSVTEKGDLRTLCLI